MEFSYAQFFSKSMPFLDKIGFFLLFIYLFLFFFYFFVNLYPTAPTKCCIPHCCHQMLYPTLLSPNVVYRFVATKCRKLDKKNDYRRWGGGKKNDFWWFYTPLTLTYSRYFPSSLFDEIKRYLIRDSRRKWANQYHQ